MFDRNTVCFDIVAIFAAMVVFLVGPAAFIADMMGEVGFLFWIIAGLLVAYVAFYARQYFEYYFE